MDVAAVSTNADAGVSLSPTVTDKASLTLSSSSSWSGTVEIDGTLGSAVV